MKWMALLLVGVGAACGSSEATPSEAAGESQEVEARPEELPEEDEFADDEQDLLDEEPAEDSPDETELDAMDESELEAACFAGHSAACDRLGH